METLKVEWTQSGSATDATLDGKVDSEALARLSGRMTIVVPESTAAETFLAPFMAEDRREDDDDVLLILSQVFTMADEDGAKAHQLSGESSKIRESGR